MGAASRIQCGRMSKTFRAWKIDEPLLLPITVQEFVGKDHLARFVLSVVEEELDLSGILSCYSSTKGQPPFHPAMMTALLLYAYCSGIYSSRRIAKACGERVDFMSMVGLDVPDFRTISEFRRRHLGALKGLFLQVLALCDKAGLTRLGHVAFDGSKIRANASRHKAMSYGRMEARASELEAEVAKWLAAAEAADAAEDKLHGRDRRVMLEACLRHDELPAWVADKRQRAARIRAAKAELETEAKAAAEAKAKAAAEAEAKRQAEGRKKPGKAAAPPSPEPAAKAQKNFSPGLDPGPGEPDHEVEGRLRAGLQRPDRCRCAGAGDRGARCDAKPGGQWPAVADGGRRGGQPRPQACASVGGFGLLLGGQPRRAGGAQDRRLRGDRPGEGRRRRRGSTDASRDDPRRGPRGGPRGGQRRDRTGRNRRRRSRDRPCARGQGPDAGCGHGCKDQVGRSRQPLSAASRWWSRCSGRSSRPAAFASSCCGVWRRCAANGQ